MEDGSASVRTWEARGGVAQGGSSFEEFFDAEMGRLLRSLAVITGSPTEAEDIAQEAFVRVYERWDRVREMTDPVGYLHRAAMNVFRSRYRRAMRLLGRRLPFVNHDDPLRVVEDRDEIDRILASLTPRQRAAIVLTEALGYSGEEAGHFLGIRSSTVYALRHQARMALEQIPEATDA